MAVLIILGSRPDLNNRFFKQFITNIPITNATNENPYWGAWRGGIQQGFLTLVKGIGPLEQEKHVVNLILTYLLGCQEKIIVAITLAIFIFSYLLKQVYQD